MSNTNKPNGISPSQKPSTNFGYRKGAQTPIYRRPSAPPPPKPQK